LEQGKVYDIISYLYNFDFNFNFGVAWNVKAGIWMYVMNE